MEVVTATSPIRYFFFIQSPINSAFSQQISTTHNHSWPSISSIHLRSSSFRHKGRFSHRFVACNSLQNSADDATSDRIAVLLEVDG
ncbi:hypothetical protein SOVF_027870 [Spinacia oleracea]|nr:hypothetical protein SOVF_027870 [Spinacia oleracea]